MNDIEKAGLICALEMDPEFRARVRELLTTDAPVRAPRAVPRATVQAQRAAVPTRPEPPSEYRPAWNPQRAVRNVSRDD